MLNSVDEWLLGATEKVLEFCADWLSLSQRHIERALIICNAAAVMAVQVIDPHTTLTIITLVVITAPMLLRHRAPQAVRTALRVSEKRSRLVWIALTMLVNVPMALSFRDALTLWQAVLYATFTWFHYVIACSSDGQRGKKRRLALDQVKRLFGTGWIPQPVGAQG
jgi:hypothetical protein